MAGKDSKSFEKSLQELEQVVGKLETGNLALEESIALYEKGVKLNRECEQALKIAEEKIDKLKTILQVANQPPTE